MLVAAYLLVVPLQYPEDSAREGGGAASRLPLLEAVEHAALRKGVPVDARIEKGRSATHALQRLWEIEHFDRIVAPAASGNCHGGFSVKELTWILTTRRPRRSCFAPHRRRGRGGLTAEYAVAACALCRHRAVALFARRAGSTSSTATGLRGHATIGPLTPVCRADTPCRGPARHVTLLFRRVAVGATARSTDGSGDYRIALRSGAYIVTAGQRRPVRPAKVLANVVAGRCASSISRSTRASAERAEPCPRLCRGRRRGRRRAQSGTRGGSAAARSARSTCRGRTRTPASAHAGST